MDAPAGEDLFGDAARDAQRGRETAGEVSAAPHVRRAAPLDGGGKIRMTGTGRVREAGIIGGVLVGVFDDGAQRRAAGPAVFKARQEYGHVPLLAGGGEGAAAASAAVQKGLQFLGVHGLPGGKPVDDHADGLAVGLAEYADLDERSKLRGHGLHLLRTGRPPRNPGRIF